MRIFGDRTNPQAALAAMLLGAVIQSACIGDAVDVGQGDRPTNAPVASGSKPDLHIGSSLPAMPASGGASRKQSQSAGSVAPAADGGTQAPAASQACTEAAQCASGFCVDGVLQRGLHWYVRTNQRRRGRIRERPLHWCQHLHGFGDGQPVCKLKERQICSTNAECASGSCGSIVVPPDPADPYDVGYTYIGCE